MASAQPASGSMSPIERLDAALLAAMKAGRASPFVQRYRMLDPVIAQVFDLQTVLAESVGFAWFSATAAQGPAAWRIPALHRVHVHSELR
jgi:hypothetical protein